MSQGKVSAIEAQKKPEPARQAEQEVARQPEQGAVQVVAPQAAYRCAQVSRNGLRPVDLLALQRTVGNRVVQQMVARFDDSTNVQPMSIPKSRFSATGLSDAPSQTRQTVLYPQGDKEEKLQARHNADNQHIFSEQNEQMVQTRNVSATNHVGTRSALQRQWHSVLQRDNKGTIEDWETEDWQKRVIPQELMTSIDTSLLSELSDEELRRRSELILATLRQFNKKTPTTQFLEDEVMRITLVLTKRPSDVGKRVVENYIASPRKFPGGECYAAALERIREAYADILGEGLTESMPKDKTMSAFDTLWGSHIERKRVWKLLPEEYRGKGAAGAMAYAGKGTIVEQEQIWSGDLLPGAVLQTWQFKADFNRVREGENAKEGYGHSFIFLRYKRKEDKPDAEIEGIEIADQGFQSRGVLGKNKYEYWVAANIAGNLPSGRGPGDVNLIRTLLSGRNRIRGGESQATNFNLSIGARFRVEASKIVSEIKKASTEFTDEDIKKAINSLNPDRFNIYFTHLVALYQLGSGISLDGRFGNATCRRLTGQSIKTAQILQRTK